MKTWKSTKTDEVLNRGKIIKVVLHYHFHY